MQHGSHSRLSHTGCALTPTAAASPRENSMDPAHASSHAQLCSAPMRARVQSPCVGSLHWHHAPLACALCRTSACCERRTRALGACSPSAFDSPPRVLESALDLQARLDVLLVHLFRDLRSPCCSGVRRRDVGVGSSHRLAQAGRADVLFDGGLPESDLHRYRHRDVW